VLRRALRTGGRAAATLAALPGRADVLVTPVLAAPPARVGALTGLATLAQAGRVVPFTPAWNVTGQPALALPAGLDPEGLPLAVQLIGRPGTEELLPRPGGGRGGGDGLRRAATSAAAGCARLALHLTAGGPPA
jgi:Asp-tRNA(Asn)/Glu-tRNA(Gln) amidotransferase A subunit family amidase